jgi:hypothetical protein
METILTLDKFLLDFNMIDVTLMPPSMEMFLDTGFRISALSVAFGRRRLHRSEYHSGKELADIITSQMKDIYERT